MRFAVALHLVGALMWFGGLLSALRILIERTKEPPETAARFVYLAKGFLWFTALPGAILTTSTGAILLGGVTGDVSAWGLQRIAKLVLFLGIAGVHGALVVHERRLTRRGEETRMAVLSLEHKLVLFGALAVLFASVGRPG